MILEDFFKLFQKLENDNACFIYQAKYADDEITENLLKLSDYIIQSNKDITKLKKRISFLMVECFQNILRHGDRPQIVHKTNDVPEMFIARNIGNNFFIGSTNLIDNKKVDGVRQKLQDINKLDKDELKALYRKIFEREKFSEKGGAGLGLIEMARKSGEKLSFDFVGVNFYLSLFYLQLILKGSAENEEPGSEKLPISEVRDLHQIIYKEDVLMVYKGDFSQKSILPLLDMIEKNLKLKVQSGEKKIFYLLVEILQNVSKHAMMRNEVREGIFLIGIKDNKYYINIGNFIENEQVESLRNKLLHINSLEEESLSELYKKNLISDDLQAKGGAGLGLIDIARYSHDKLRYGIWPVDNDSSFFSMSVVID